MDVERHRLHSDADGDDSKQSLRGDVGGECSNDSGCQEDGPRADEVLACVVKFRRTITLPIRRVVHVEKVALLHRRATSPCLIAG